MSLSEPEVIEGAREPRAARLAALASPDAPPQRSTGPVSVKPGKMLFQAVATRYRLQLTAPQDTVLPDGRRIQGRPIALQFDNGFAELDLVKDAEKIKLVLEHPSLGIDFWDFTETLKQIKQAQVDQTLKILEDPENRKAILAALKASGNDDFSLPTMSKTILEKQAEAPKK